MQLDTRSHYHQSIAAKGSGAKLSVTFSIQAKRNDAKSAEAGRLICDDVEYIRIVVPGERDAVHRPAIQRDREEYPQEYARFIASEGKDSISGTRLNDVPFMTPAMVRELAFFDCHTVEQLAAMPDGNLAKFPGARKLQQQAKDFLAVAEGNAPVAQLRAELSKRDAEIDLLKRQLEDAVSDIKTLKRK